MISNLDVVVTNGFGQEKMVVGGLVLRLWRGTATVLVLSLLTQPDASWQPAAPTRPPKCGACHPTARPRLVLRLWRGTAAEFILSLLIQPDASWQPVAGTTPPKFGNRAFAACVFCTAHHLEKTIE